jgi:hypothetical protein
MSRKGEHERLDQLRDAIQDNPGHRAGWFARLLGFDNKTVTRALPQLEDRGELLAEDDDGRLSWFGRDKS